MTNPETLRVMCPNLTCRKILAVPTSARGKTVRCRSCQTNIRIPGLVAKEPEQKERPSGNAAA
jgi:LSD1 subclass zinc finger protein